jgi:sugar lactone lactonase YvrE
MCVYDAGSNKYYVAAYSNGLSIVESPSVYTNLSPNGPALNDPFTMKFVGEKLYVSTSGTWVSGIGKEDIPGAVMIYDGFSWINITDAQIPPLHGSFISVLDFAVDPDDPSHFFVGTWHKALYEFRNNTFYERYNSNNSAIQSPFGLDMYQIVDGLVFDKNKNLWMTQSVASDAIKVLKSDGTWKSFYFSAFTSKNTIQKMMIDKNGFKWINVPRSGPGVFVFDDNGTIDDISDDRSKFISTFYDQDERSFTSSSFRCIVEDNSIPKKLWIGTANGPIIVTNSENIFNTVNVRCARIKIPRNDGTNLADYLLENEAINAIAVDGANRKWLATKTSGVFLVSENGTETIHHFTTANSPILSDNVLAVAINSNTGEVFFGTDQGIISYAGDATSGGNVFANAYAYPNPVRENFEGVISIVGLIANSNVKITDVAGNLIYEATSNGGMLTWDGKPKHSCKNSHREQKIK